MRGRCGRAALQGRAEGEAEQHGRNGRQEDADAPSSLTARCSSARTRRSSARYACAAQRLKVELRRKIIRNCSTGEQGWQGKRTHETALRPKKALASCSSDLRAMTRAFHASSTVERMRCRARKFESQAWCVHGLDEEGKASAPRPAAPALERRAARLAPSAELVRAKLRGAKSQ